MRDERQERSMQRDIGLSFDEWRLAKLTADQRMKANNGHCYVTILKTRCQFCGRSPRAKGKCGRWFSTFLWHLDVILWNIERERVGWQAVAKDRAGENGRIVTGG